MKIYYRAWIHDTMCGGLICVKCNTYEEAREYADPVMIDMVINGKRYALTLDGKIL